MAGQPFFYLVVSEPQRQLKFHSVLLAGKESNLLHEDGSSNVLTYPGKQPPGAKASQQRKLQICLCLNVAGR